MDELNTEIFIGESVLGLSFLWAGSLDDVEWPAAGLLVCLKLLLWVCGTKGGANGFSSLLCALLALPAVSFPWDIRPHGQPLQWAADSFQQRGKGSVLGTSKCARHTRAVEGSCHT